MWFCFQFGVVCVDVIVFFFFEGRLINLRVVQNVSTMIQYTQYTVYAFFPSAFPRDKLKSAASQTN